jgi:hypothetical protein
MNRGSPPTSQRSYLALDSFSQCRKRPCRVVQPIARLDLPRGEKRREEKTTTYNSFVISPLPGRLSPSSAQGTYWHGLPPSNRAQWEISRLVLRSREKFGVPTCFSFCQPDQRKYGPARWRCGRMASGRRLIFRLHGYMVCLPY